MTGFSAHLCDLWLVPPRQQKPIVTTLLSEHSNDAFKSNVCDRTRLGQFCSDHICMMVRAKGLITLLLYCSKGKLRISLCKQIATVRTGAWGKDSIANTHQQFCCTPHRRRLIQRGKQRAKSSTQAESNNQIVSPIGAEVQKYKNPRGMPWNYIPLTQP